MNLLTGIDLQQGREVATEVPVVPNRILHVDADIVAYEISGKKGGFIRKDEVREECECYIDALKQAAGAEIVMCHTTPSGSDKGDRYNLARLKVYQGNRKDKVKPPLLEYTREYLVKPNGNKWFGIAHMDQEADDGLAQVLYDARQEGKPELAVCASMDKDLRMLEGWHLDWETHELFQIDRMGYLEDTGKKVYGTGLKWMFFQLLRGDTADNISGLPKVPLSAIEAYTTKKCKKPPLCGDKMVLQLLDGAETLEELFTRVTFCYKMFDEEEVEYTLMKDKDGNKINVKGFHNYRKEKINAKTAFLSESYLLWMRETKHPKDFNRWIKENGMLELYKEMF